MTRTARFRTCVLLLLLALLAPPLSARGLELFGPSKEPSVLAWLRHALGELVPALDKSRGTMDPNGSPASPPPPPASEGDSRGTMDPNG